MIIKYSKAIPLLQVLILLNINARTYVRSEQVEDFLLEPRCTDLRREFIEHHLSTKSPYRAVANLDDNFHDIQGCQPQRLWALIRHGTRNPSKKIIQQANNQLTNIRDLILKNSKNNLCSDEKIRLRYWQSKLNETEEKLLVEEGSYELISLAERMQKRFPQILPEYYDPHYYYFKFTKTQRTEESANSFATGLFGRENIRSIMYPEALHRDPILRFYKLCQRWRANINKNPETYQHVKMFLQEPQILDAVDFVKRKTQLANITAEEVNLMYTICAFETAWYPKSRPSIWCNFFNEHTLKALEFASDLKYYWKDGYGLDLTRKIACPAIKDLFESISPTSTKANATLYFTHSGTILKVLAHLGLYKDAQPLTFKDYRKQRSWRTSAIDAFASNIAFVLYKCEDDESKILTLHQERPVRLPGCPPDNDLCSLSTLQQIYANSLNHCNFSEMCDL